MIDFEPIPKLVFDAEGAREYLGLKSVRSLENLVSAKRLTPLKICKENLFARSELDALIERELERERRLRGTNNGEST